jgi:hypothetical protein
MPKLGKKIEINASIKKVWEVLTDFQLYLKWQIDKIAMKELEPNKYFEKTTSGSYTITITELIENERMSLKVDHPEITGVSYILNKKAEMTVVSCWVNYKGILANEKMIVRSLDIKANSLKNYAEYLEDGGDPDEYDKNLIIVKP